MPHFSVAQKSDLATTSEDIFRGKLIANGSCQVRMSSGSQHRDQLSLTRISSDDNCEKLQKSFVTFPTDDANHEATKICESAAVKANADEFSEGSKEEKSTTAAKYGENFFTDIWKENAVDETNKKKKTQKFPRLL